MERKMLKAILQYTDCFQDGRNVFSVLATNNIQILKTQTPIFSIYPRVTVLFEDTRQLNQVLYDLNQKCRYEVRLVKIKNM